MNYCAVCAIDEKLCAIEYTHLTIGAIKVCATELHRYRIVSKRLHGAVTIGGEGLAQMSGGGGRGGGRSPRRVEKVDPNIRWSRRATFLCCVAPLRVSMDDLVHD